MSDIRYISNPIQGQAAIDITSGMSGYFAVHYWWNPKGFHEPWDTGIGRYRTAKEAYQEAKEMAIELDLPLLKHPELED